MHQFSIVLFILFQALSYNLWTTNKQKKKTEEQFVEIFTQIVPREFIQIPKAKKISRLVDKLCHTNGILQPHGALIFRNNCRLLTKKRQRWDIASQKLIIKHKTVMAQTCSPSAPPSPTCPVTPSRPFAPTDPGWPIAPGSPITPWNNIVAVTEGLNSGLYE